MMLLPVVLLVAAASGPPPLKIEISSPRSAVLAGEPLKLIARWSARRPTSVFVEEGEFLGHTSFVIGEGEDVRIYREVPRGQLERILAPVTLSPGQELVTSLVLAYGVFEDDRSAMRLALDHAGRYTVQLRYRERSGEPPVDSNSIDFVATTPPAEEAHLFESLKKDPELLDLAKAQSRGLLDRYPTSPYLRWTMLVLEEQRYLRFVNGHDPDTGDYLLSLPDRERVERQKAVARKLMDRVNASGPWGSLEEERLRLARRHAANAGDRQTEERLEDEILKRFPVSAAAADVRRSKTIRKEEAERLTRP